jgi:hypothetical protein
MEQTAQSDNAGQAFFFSFMVCLLIVSLPVKNIAYLAAPVYLGLQAARGQYQCLLRTFLISAALLFVSALSLLWDSMNGKDVNLPGMLLAIVTYLPFIVVIAERPDKYIDERLFGKFVTVACWFVIIQSLIGIAQFAMSGNPDTVCGTFGLFDFLTSGVTITQVFFTFTLFGMILLMLVAPLTFLSVVAILLGLVTCALAHSGHQTIFFIGSLAVLGISRVSRPTTTLITAAVAGMLFFAMLAAYPRTIEGTQDWFGKVISHSNSPKRMAVEGGITTLSNTKNLALGTGLGQYSSRAALITSNQYLGVSLPSFMVGVSSDHAKYIVPASRVFNDVGEGSAISKPYFSWLSFLVELGVIQFSFLVVIIGFAFAQNWRLMQSRIGSVARIGFVANVGILFFLLCCTIENYAEFPQATFIPFLLYIAILSKAKTELSRASTFHAIDDESIRLSHDEMRHDTVIGSLR